jgi:hypothetical protein
VEIDSKESQKLTTEEAKRVASGVFELLTEKDAARIVESEELRRLLLEWVIDDSGQALQELKKKLPQDLLTEFFTIDLEDEGHDPEDDLYEAVRLQYDLLILEQELAEERERQERERTESASQELALQKWSVKEGNDPIEVDTEKCRFQLTLKTPQILILGEGEKFEYAINLAKKHGDKLVLATQFDWTVPPGGLPENLLVYRHQDKLGKDDKDFDVTDAKCWNDLAKRFGPFYAIVFNNPHAGNGLPKQQVYGVKKARVVGQTQDKKPIFEPIVVQTWVCDTLFDTLGRRGQLIDYSGEPRALKTSDVFRLGCGKDGYQSYIDLARKCTKCKKTVAPSGYAPQSRKMSCPQCKKVGLDLDHGVCPQCQHPFLVYLAKVKTEGLNPYILKGFLLHGAKHVAQGGTLNVNGPSWLNYYLLKEDWLKDYAKVALPVAGTAAFKDCELFASYSPNLTHSNPHCSWGESTTQAANPKSMTRYFWTRKS